MKILDLQEQKKLLEKYLVEINTVVTAKIGFKTNFEVVEYQDYAKRVLYGLKDKRNVKNECGIMSVAFTEVIMTGSLYWNDDDTTILFYFEYQHINGGSNGCEFWRLIIDYKNKVVRFV